MFKFPREVNKNGMDDRPQFCFYFIFVGHCYVMYPFDILSYYLKLCLKLISLYTGI